MQNAMSSKHRFVVDDAGIQPYRSMWLRQQQTADALIAAKAAGTAGEERLILVEHTPVFTLGKHGHADNMLRSPQWLADKGIDCVRTDRGGDITYHGPGQLVAYPIIDMEAHRLGVKAYVHLLEETVLQLIARYGIHGERVEGATGVWLEHNTPRERKICAIGIHCHRFVTMHGLALNVNTDLRYFHDINPCGFIDKGVTSMAQELGRSVDMNEVKTQFVEIFRSLLNA